MGDSIRGCLLQCLNCAYFFWTQPEFATSFILSCHLFIWGSPFVTAQCSVGCAGFRVTTTEARSPITTSSSLFLRRFLPLQRFLQPVRRLLACDGKLHLRGKKKVLQCSSPSESLALLSCHGGWWLIADKVLLGCRRLEVPADCQWGQLVVMEVVWARDEKSRWPDTMWSRLHEHHRAWHRIRYTVKTLDLFGPLCRLIFASVWNYFWNIFLKWGVVLG